MSDPSYLPTGLPQPVVDADGLSAPFWQGLRDKRLLVQRCSSCGNWQFGPEWICHNCHAFELAWSEVPAAGQIFSWERVWHPVHPVLKARGPYLAVLIALSDAPGIRLLGNLLGDPMQEVRIGAPVEGAFEDHPEGTPPFTLLQWRLRQSGPSTG